MTWHIECPRHYSDCWEACKRSRGKHLAMPVKALYSPRGSLWYIPPEELVVCDDLRRIVKSMRAGRKA